MKRSSAPGSSLISSFLGVFDMSNCYPGTVFRTSRGNHRLHELLSTLVLTNASIQTSITYRAGGDINWTFGTYASFECIQFDAEVRMPLGGVIETVIANKSVDSIEIGVYEKSWDYGKPRPGEMMGPNVLAINSRLIIPFFIEFYEDNREWLESYSLGLKAKRQYLWMLWPNVWQFAHVIRNAMAHGGGRITIKDKSFSPINWHGATVGPSQLDKTLFEVGLSFGDLIILMFEMSNSLDQLGCPT